MEEKMCRKKFEMCRTAAVPLFSVCHFLNEWNVMQSRSGSGSFFSISCPPSVSLPIFLLSHYTPPSLPPSHPFFATASAVLSHTDTSVQGQRTWETGKRGGGVGGCWATSETSEAKWEIKGGEKREKKSREEEEKQWRRGKMRTPREMEKRWKAHTYSLINMVGMWPHGKSLSWQ